MLDPKVLAVQGIGGCQLAEGDVAAVAVLGLDASSVSTLIESAAAVRAAQDLGGETNGAWFVAS
jgi:hypothetical protein